MLRSESGYCAGSRGGKEGSHPPSRSAVRTPAGCAPNNNGSDVKPREDVPEGNGLEQFFVVLDHTAGKEAFDDLASQRHEV